MKRELTCIMDICEQMLVCGAEISRVEDCIRRLGHAFGAERVDAFIIISSMQVTLYDGERRAYNQGRRIINIGMDLERLHQLNDLSRRICAERMDVAAAEQEFQKICRCKRYPEAIKPFCYALISGAFTLFFGGHWAEAGCSFGIGLLLGGLVMLTERLRMNKLFSRLISSFFAISLAFLLCRLGILRSVDKTIIGNIMTLIPGVGLTNALRDLFAGDSTSGLLRTVEVILLALAIAGGYFLAAFLLGGAA